MNFPGMRPECKECIWPKLLVYVSDAISALTQESNLLELQEIRLRGKEIKAKLNKILGGKK